MDYSSLWGRGKGGKPQESGLLNLDKNQLLDLTKQAPSLKRLVFAAKWDINVPGKENFDLDISALLLDREGRVKLGDIYTKVVYFNQRVQNGIFLEKDNLTGGNEDGDDERIDIDLEEIDPDVHEILFCVMIYNAMELRQTFGMISNSYVRLLDADNGERELCRFELRDNASNATAVMFAKLIRNRDGRGWSFKTIGEPLVVTDLNQILLKFIKD